jgi:ABC-type sugar transport system ATPase subunit
LAFQEPVFVAGTVAQNLDLGLRLRGLCAQDRQGRITEVARELDIQHLLERPARALSRGEAQRVNLARALSLRAPVTLLDEPLAALDAGIRRLLLDDLPSLLARLATTTLLVTHDCEEAIRLADRIVVLVAGRVRAAGTAGEVLRRPPSVEVARILGYLVLRLQDRWIGIPPGALRVGEGPPTIEFEVERVVETATRPEVIGRIAGQRARVALPSEQPPPAPGDRLPIALDQAVPLPEDGGLRA